MIIFNLTQPMYIELSNAPVGNQSVIGVGYAKTTEQVVLVW